MMSKTRTGKLNSKCREGFSLIELIIAIAILALMVGMISLSIAMLRSADTKGLASHINDSLTDLKAVTEAHTGPYYLHLFKQGDGYYKTFDTKKDDEFDPTSVTVESSDRLGADAMTVVVAGGDKTGTLGTDVDCITIRINKKDGSYYAGAPLSFSVYRGKDTSGDPDYKVVLAEKTGLHYLD